MIGYIYIIYGFNKDGDILTYYGSTVNFNNRKNAHLNPKSRSILVNKIMTECEGKWFIKIIEKINYNYKFELLMRENEYIKNRKCLNVRPAISETWASILIDKHLIKETELPSTSELIYF